MNEVASFNSGSRQHHLTQTRILSEFTDALDTTDITINTLSDSTGELRGDAASGFTFSPDANTSAEVTLTFTLTDANGNAVTDSDGNSELHLQL